jgi:LmbE family N-acetylglucosaminyl deacetylase
VTVTAGNVGSHPSEALFPDPVQAHLERARIRVWESVRMPQTGGVPASQIVNLGHFDGTLPAMFDGRNVPAVSLKTGIRDVARVRRDGTALELPRGLRDAMWNKLVEDLLPLIRAIEPAHIVLPHPSPDDHPDHPYSAAALLEALEASGLKRGRFLF